MENSSVDRIMMNRKKIIILAIVLLLVLIIYWLFTHSRISVQIAGNGDGEITYSFRDTATGDTKELKSSDNAVSVWVKRGSYEVRAASKSGGYIEFVPSTPLFYSKQQISGELKPERKRLFVGDGVRHCAGLAGSTLVSGGCEGVYGELSIHVPATKNTPTYIRSNPDRSVFGENQNLLSTGDTLTQIIKSDTTFEEGTEDSSNDPSKYMAVSFTDKSSKSKKIDLLELEGEDQYLFKDNGGVGFVAFEIDSGKVVEYNQDAKKVSGATFNKPNNQSIDFVAIDYMNSSAYASLYSTATDTAEKNTISEVVVTRDSRSANYAFKGKQYMDLKICGDNKICLLGGDSGMDVYDISSERANLDFSVVNVSSFARSTSGELLAVSDIGVLNIDANTRKGFMEYTLGGYIFNELSVHNAAYVLRLTDDKDRIVGLYVDQTEVNTDSIDKKRLDLQSLAEVKYVSVNNSYIYVVAELGEPVYIEEINSFGYNEEVRKSTADKINAEIDRLGIDRSKYTITSNAF